ncbi:MULTISPECIES: iron transporter [unclassified Methylobacterium]|uniref:iron transporter n=1 Tax=unclassified Methylobacterium TaxID=2615210 RepID=UPI000AAFEE58|nr:MULTISPECIES: iron transporter [unclassified Methylobacterium]
MSNTTSTSIRSGSRLVGGARIAGRVALATGGGYGIAALVTALLSLTLPLSRPEAVTTATLLSFAVMAGVVVLVFAMRSLLRATVMTAGAAIVIGGSLWLVASAGAGF